jgi:hypothetical protein
MMKTILNALIIAAGLLISMPKVSAAEVKDLVKQLGSAKEEERAQAIAELRKMGESARDALLKIEVTETLEPQQLLLVRKLLGEYLIIQTPLKPVDLTTLTPFSEDKEKKIEGNPNLLTHKDSKVIALNGEFALEQGALEFLVVTKGPNARLHETVIAVYARPRDICWALLACAYTYAGELGEDGKINLPKDAGVMISVQFEWEVPHAKMADGVEVPGAVKKTMRIPIEFCVWNSQTEKPMKRSPFAFTGSKFEKDPETKRMVFKADEEKSIVAVKTDPFAIMNTPLDMRDVDPQHGAGYSVNRHVLPKRGYKCVVIFEPWVGGELKKEDVKDTGNRAAAPAPPPTPVQQ